MILLLTLGIWACFVVGVSVIWAFPVKWLWNYAVAGGLLAGNAHYHIDFWHAWALLVLCGLLFKPMSNTSVEKKA